VCTTCGLDEEWCPACEWNEEHDESYTETDGECHSLALDGYGDIDGDPSLAYCEHIDANPVPKQIDDDHVTNEIGDENPEPSEIGKENLVQSEIGCDSLVPKEIGCENLVPNKFGYDNLVPKETGDENLVLKNAIGDDNLAPYAIGCENLAPKTDPAPDENLEGDDDGDGTIERASLAVQGHVRVIEDCLELKLGTTIPLESAAMKRLARHAAWTHDDG
jgi:hypothetical protein